MSRDNFLLLRDCAACMGAVVGGFVTYVGLCMVVAALVGFLLEAVDLGLSLHIDWVWKVELAVTGVVSGFFGYRTYAMCVDEIPEVVRIVCGVVIVLVVIAILTVVVFLGAGLLVGYGWATAVTAIWLVFAFTSKPPRAFRG